METQRRIVVGRIGAAHGVRGEVRVKAFTTDPMALGDYGRLMSQTGTAFEIETLRPAKEVVIVKFRGVNARNAAEALNGTDLYVDRDTLPPVDEDEFYHADLIGLEAYDDGGTLLGAVVAVHDFGAGDILDIAPSRGPSLLVPFTKAAAPVIDVAAGRIVVIPPASADDDEDAAEPGETHA